MVNHLQTIGLFTFYSTRALGKFGKFIGKTLYRGLQPPYYRAAWKAQAFEFGYLSLTVVGITALFTGMVLALQSYTGMSRFHGESAVASIVALSMARELAPVLGGLMVVSRMGASIAAELGTMRVSEQIDAITTLATDPLRYLIFPRILMGTLFLPFLVFIAILIGILGGLCIAVYDLGLPAGNYIAQTLNALTVHDIALGLTKGAVFGFILASVSCYCGFYAKGGAKGVGAAATGAVVSASIAILLANYVLTALLFRG